MRRTKYFVANTLDGFISRQDRRVNCLFMDQDYGLRKFFESVGVAGTGRKTYDRMQKLAPGKAPYPGRKNYVFTTTKPSGIRDEVEFISTGGESWAERIRSEAGKDIWLVEEESWFGSSCKSNWWMRSA